MDNAGGMHDIQGLQSSLFFETPEEIYARVFRELRPRTPLPDLRVEFRRFANADSFIRLENGRLEVRISDLLAGAPAPVMEALAHILLGKLYRKPVPRLYAYRYRLYLNRRDVRRQAHLVRQVRGRKFISGPQGAHHNIEEIFERLNGQFFDGLLGRPQLGWSRRPSRTTPSLSAASSTSRLRLWLWSTSCFTKCCTCAIPWTIPRRAAGCIRGNSGKRRRNSHNSRKPRKY